MARVGITVLGMGGDEIKKKKRKTADYKLLGNLW